MAREKGFTRFLFVLLIGIFINSSIVAYGVGNNDFNISGNIMSLGYIAKEGDWIYYSNISDGSKLYKSKVDGTNETKLSDDIPNYINVSGDWIYFSNVSDSFKIYKVKNDGSKRIKLNDESSFWTQVIDDTIVYARRDQAGQKLYKMTTDGGKKTRINKDSVYGFVVADGWVYYPSEGDNHKIYKVDLNGENTQKLNEDQSFNLLYSEGNIYYQNSSEGQKIYRIQIDGKNRTKISDDSAEYINLSQGFIYYSNLSDELKLYKVKIDGTNKSKLSEEGAGVINIIDNNLYYMIASKKDGGMINVDPSNLIRIKNDGTSREVVKVLTESKVEEEPKKLTAGNIALLIIVMGIPFSLEIWKMISFSRLKKFVHNMNDELTDDDAQRFIDLIKSSRLIKRSDTFELLATCIKAIKSSSKVSSDYKEKAVNILEKRGIKLNI